MYVSKVVGVPRVVSTESNSKRKYYKIDKVDGAYLLTANKGKGKSPSVSLKKENTNCR